MAKHVAKCPKCGGQFDVEGAPGGRVACPNCAATLRLPGSPKPTAPTDPLIGQTLGEFEILELLGRGGMGAVYKARQASLDRLVALKVLPQRFARNAKFVERFSREARSAAAVRHPNIIEVFAVGEAGGHQYIAMEFIEGETLASLLKREGRLPPAHALDVLKQTASALAEAHECGILHRDIKPSNILLDRKGRVKVADFGLAKRPDIDVSVTATGVALGTPLYIAPEAARATPLDARSDLYSLGATFYHVLAGRPPFEGAGAAQLILKHAEAKVPPLADLAPDTPVALCRIIHRLLRKNPADRYESAERLLEALDRLGPVGGTSPSRAKSVGGVSAPRVSSAATHTLPPDARPKHKTTARKEAVGGASLPRVLPRWVWVAGGTAAALVLVVVLVVALGRPPAVAPPAPAWQGAWKEAEAKATALLAEERFGEAMKAYQALADRFDDVGLKRGAEKAISAVHRSAETAYGEAERRARELVAEEKFQEARVALRPVVERYGIQRLAQQAKTMLADIESREKRKTLAEALAKWKQIKASADKLTQEGRYKEAVALLESARDLDVHNIAHLIGERIKVIADIESREKRKKLDEPLAKWKQIKASADKLTHEGKYKEALGVLESARDIGLDNIADLIAEQAKPIKEAWRAAVERALMAYAGQSDTLWALFKTRNYTQADKLIARLEANPEYTLAAPHVQADAEAAQLLRDFWKAVEKGLAALKGRTLVIGGAGGTVESVKDGVITIKTPRGESKRGSVRDLAPKQVVHYSGLKLQPDARSKLPLAIFLLAEGAELDEAKDAFAKAGGGPAVAIYQERLDTLMLGTREAAARAAWRRIEGAAGGKLTRSAARRLEAKLGDLERQHGQTTFYKGLGEPLATLTARIAKATGPTVYTQWPFDAAEANRRQLATARALGVKVEEDIDLGGRVKLTMVLIPAGEFLMGSPEKPPPEELAKIYGGKAKWFQRERPEHRVRITKPFWLGKFEVTQEQWQAVMGNNPSTFKGPENPVEQVSWNDCQTFLTRLNEKIAMKGFRLPAEAQWEYACRAGTTTQFHFGNAKEQLSDYAWWGPNSRGRTHPVGRRKPNSWSLHDMHRNVWEWCADWYGCGSYTAEAQTDPTGPANGAGHAIRGGSLINPAGYCRSATRSACGPEYRESCIGLRVSRPLP